MGRTTAGKQNRVQHGHAEKKSGGCKCKQIIGKSRARMLILSFLVLACGFLFVGADMAVHVAKDAEGTAAPNH